MIQQGQRDLFLSLRLTSNIHAISLPAVAADAALFKP